MRDVARIKEVVERGQGSQGDRRGVNSGIRSGWVGVSRDRPGSWR